MHIHLDPLGGLAGDMFAGSLLDAFPEHLPAVRRAIGILSFCPAIGVSLERLGDGVLDGSRFAVSAAGPGGAHGHQRWSGLRAELEASALDGPVKRHAIGIFSELAAAEAQVHGKAVEDVTFHEVGNWDSIADIVAAAALIHAISASGWSVSSLPLGRGRVQTAHGELPIPAPATALLLKGLVCHDDGRSGERVTPTGAAILRHLRPKANPGGRLLRSGIGFGTRRMEGVSNVLRILAFKPETGSATDQVSVIEFEIDDQTGEELALGLDHLRKSASVIDVLQYPAMGKKGRMVTAIRVLARPEAANDVARACFTQTTTLGLRLHTAQRRVLHRREVENSDGLRVKVSRRPGGDTAKTDLDGVASEGSGHDARMRLRQMAEWEALKARDGDE